jgi:hypothetical protein
MDTQAILVSDWSISIWPSGFRGKDLKKLTNQKQELPVAAKFVNESGRN